MPCIVTALVLFAVTLPLAAQVEGEHIKESSAHPVAAIQDTETPAQRDARMAWWREARFGMFIHWGLYSIPAGTWDGKRIPSIGEWIMNTASIPVADYKALAPQFNPTAFSAHDIVALAKSAGMKYIVITSKHHDGFAMFNSPANRFNIVAGTPFHRDPLRELADECRKQGLKLGFYYSQDQDWTAPGGAAYKTDHHDRPNHHWDPAQDGNFAEYLHTKAIPQLKELLTNYGEFPAVIWFDTPTDDMTPELAGEIVALMNQHPNLIWNNRLGGGYKGDTETPEQYIPAKGYPGRDWEACMTMNDTWGYKSYDLNFKSTETPTAQPHRYRQQRRQLPAQHWARLKRQRSSGRSRAAASRSANGSPSMARRFTAPQQLSSATRQAVSVRLKRTRRAKPNSFPSGSGDRPPNRTGFMWSSSRGPRAAFI